MNKYHISVGNANTRVWRSAIHAQPPRQPGGLIELSLSLLSKLGRIGIDL